jgi:hypothetical protein
MFFRREMFAPEIGDLLYFCPFVIVSKVSHHSALVLRDRHKEKNGTIGKKTFVRMTFCKMAFFEAE